MHSTAANGRTSRGGRRIVLSGVLTIVLGAAGALLAAPAAQAQSAAPGVELAAPSTQPPAGDVVGRITMQTKLNCSSMPAKAHRYAVDHNYCPAIGDQASPQNTIVGNCGSAWIDIIDAVPGDRLARVQWGVTSSQGTMVWRQFVVSWTITVPGLDGPIPFLGSFPDIGPMFNFTYSAIGTANLGGYTRGLVSVNLNGTVELLWGGTCIIIPPGPQDIKTVT
jgi:hypothetical protein